MITEAKLMEIICKTGVGVCADFIKATKDKRRLRKKINEFAESAFESKFKHLDLTHEIDYEGLSDYLKNSLTNEIENFIVSPCDTAKETIIAKACHKANANNRYKKAVVEVFVESVIIIMKQDFIGKVDKSLMIFANDLVVGLFGNIKKEMRENTNEIMKELSVLKANDNTIISNQIFDSTQLREINENVKSLKSVIENTHINNSGANVNVHNPLDLLRGFGVSVDATDSVVTSSKYYSKNEAMKIRFCVQRKGKIAKFETTDDYLADLSYTMVPDTVDVISSVVIQNGKKTEHISDDNYTGATCCLPWLDFTEMEIYSMGLNRFTDSKFASSKLTIFPKQIQVSHDIEKSDRTVLWQGLNYKLRRSIENNNRCCYYENEVGNNRIKMNINFTFETVLQEGESIIINPQPLIDFSVTPVDGRNARSLLESYQALIKINSTDMLRFVDSKTRELCFSCGVKINNMSEQEIIQHINMYNKIIDIEEYFNMEFKLEFPMDNDLLWHINMIHGFVKNKKAIANYATLSLTTHMVASNMEIGNSYGWVSQVTICKQLFDKDLPIENVVMVCPNTKYVGQDGDTATLEIIGETIYFWDIEDRIYSNLNKDFNEILELTGTENPSPSL